MCGPAPNLPGVRFEPQNLERRIAKLPRLHTKHALHLDEDYQMLKLLRRRIPHSRT